MKIAIVGAGIVGLYLGWKLGETYDVTIFDKKQFIGKTVCSGLVSERLWNFIPKNEDLIEKTFSEMTLNFPKKKVILKLKPKMIVLDHAKLDRYVANLSDPKIIKKEILDKEDLEGFDVIIGCDGVLSKIRELYSNNKPKLKLGLIGFTDEKLNEINIWPSENGFFWKIPRKNQTEIGVMERQFTAKKMFEDKFKQSPDKAALIPFSLCLSDEVFLCGDAAGMTKPHSGGGIIWGLTAADILIKNFPNIKKYNKEVKKFFNKKIAISKLTSTVGTFLGNKIPFLAPGKKKIDSDWII